MLSRTSSDKLGSTFVQLSFHLKALSRLKRIPQIPVSSLLISPSGDSLRVMISYNKLTHSLFYSTVIVASYFLD